MSYQLVLIEKPTPADAGKPRDVGEDVFLNDIPSNYKVYLFYYPGSMGNDALEDGLRQLGEKTGHNLFVNLGKFDDPDYDRVTTRFEMKTFPVVVITAVSDLASLNNEYLSAYARLDSKLLLKSPENTVQCVLEILNLFLQGKVSDALSRAQSRQRTELLKRLGGLITGVLKPLLKFIDERDVSFSLFEGKFELKKAGG